MHTAPCEWYTFIYLHNEWEHAMESCFIWYPLSAAATSDTLWCAAEKPSALCEFLFYYLTLPNTLGTGDRFGAHFCAYSLLRTYIQAQLPLDNDRLINIRSNEFTCALWTWRNTRVFFHHFDSVAWSPVSWIKCERRTKNRSNVLRSARFFLTHYLYFDPDSLLLCAAGFIERAGDWTYITFICIKCSHSRHSTTQVGLGPKQKAVCLYAILNVTLHLFRSVIVSAALWCNANVVQLSSLGKNYFFDSHLCWVIIDIKGTIN
jgi:hypothetical protein